MGSSLLVWILLFYFVFIRPTIFSFKIGISYKTGEAVKNLRGKAPEGSALAASYPFVQSGFRYLVVIFNEIDICEAVTRGVYALGVSPMVMNRENWGIIFLLVFRVRKIVVRIYRGDVRRILPMLSSDYSIF